MSKQDEKAVGVLKHVIGKWRLFWVLESIGLSFWLALLAVKVTGNATLVDRRADDAEFWVTCDRFQCSLYEWGFIAYAHPIAVTSCALLVTNAVSTPKSSLTMRVLCPSSSGWAVCLLVVLMWVLEGFDEFVQDTAPEFFSCVNKVEYGLGALAIVFVPCHCQELRRQITVDIQRYRTVVHNRTRTYLLCVGVSLYLFDFFGQLLEHELKVPYDSSVFSELSSLLRDILWFAIKLWLIFGILAASKRPAGATTSFPAPSKKWMLFAWGFSEGGYHASQLVVKYPLKLLVDLAGAKFWAKVTLVVTYELVFNRLGWILLTGTFLWGEKPGTYGVAFWAASIFVGESIIVCATTWIHAWIDGLVK